MQPGIRISFRINKVLSYLILEVSRRSTGNGPDIKQITYTHTQTHWYLVSGVESHVLVALLTVVVGVVGCVFGELHPGGPATQEALILPAATPRWRHTQHSLTRVLHACTRCVYMRVLCVYTCVYSVCNLSLSISLSPSLSPPLPSGPGVCPGVCPGWYTVLMSSCLGSWTA